MMSFVSRLDAEQRVVTGGIALLDVMDIVRANDLQAELGSKLEEIRIDSALLGKGVVLNLDKKMVRPENLDEPTQPRSGPREILLKKHLRHHSLKAAGKADKTLGQLCQPFDIHPRLVIEALCVGFGNQPGKVSISRKISRHQAHVVIFMGRTLRPCRVGVVDNEVNLASKDGFDAMFTGAGVKVRQSEEVAVIGDAQSAHP